MPKKTAKIIDGLALADKILLDLRQKIAPMEYHPGLAAILIGDDPASKLYVNNKKKAATKIGLDFYEYLAGGELMPTISQKQILEMIDFLNADPDVDGIIVQLPLPKQFDTATIINHVDAKKDVDGFRLPARGHLANDAYVITPPLVNAVNAALDATGEKLAGKRAVIVAKSTIFSRPMKQALEKRQLKVDMVLPDDNLAAKTKKADVLIVIVGKPGIIKKSMVKPGAIVIDIGTTRIDEKKWAGDVDPEVAEVAGWVTPVPGGIGPLTVAMLLKGTYELAKNRGK